MSNNELIGRRVSVGFGVESAYGTEVAPTQWMKHTKLDFQRKTTRIENDSAVGRNEGVNDSAIVEEWAEGSLEGKMYDQSIGFLLYNIFGSVSSAANTDASGSVYDHTFSIANSNVAKSLTIARVDGAIAKRRHGMATLDELDITTKQGDFVRIKAALKAKSGTTSTDTPAFVKENHFTSKHVTVKLAANLAGLTGATAIAAKSVSLNLKRDSTPWYPLGSIDPAAFETGKWTFNGEFVLRYDASTLEDLWFANTAQALSIVFKNTDVTIGTSTNPGLVITAPQVRLHTFGKSDDLDSIVEQTVGFTGELSLADGYMLQAVLTNLKTSY
jgi:hypothetical protein